MIYFGKLGLCRVEKYSLRILILDICIAESDLMPIGRLNEGWPTLVLYMYALLTL